MENDWDYLIKLDEELLKGGIIINESIAELIRNVDICYVNEAYFSVIITAVAIIECLLKIDIKESSNFNYIIAKSDFDSGTKKDIHELRKVRNIIMHNVIQINEKELLINYNSFLKREKELSKKAIKTMRKVLYSNQFV